MEGFKIEKNVKQYLIFAALIVSMLVALLNLSSVLEFLNEVIRIILPIIIGGILALFVSVPMNGIKKFLAKTFKKMKLDVNKKQLHILSFILTVICIVVVLVIILTMLIPELTSSSQNLFTQIKANLPTLWTYLDAFEFDTSGVKEFLSEMTLENAVQQITNGVDTVLPNIADVVTSTVGIVMTVVFSLVISIYITLESERVSRHVKKFAVAYLKPKHSNFVLKFGRSFYSFFSKFLSGQSFEAIILGSLMFIMFEITGLPYGSLVGIITAVCAIIPYVGAFVSCGISILLTVMLDPTLVVRCAIVYLSTQFVENQFIYPRVVGESVGLTPLYTLVAAMIGGKLFGVIGIIFFIPFVATIVDIVSDDANDKLGCESGEMINV